MLIKGCSKRVNKGFHLAPVLIVNVPCDKHLPWGLMRPRSNATKARISMCHKVIDPPDRLFHSLLAQPCGEQITVRKCCARGCARDRWKMVEMIKLIMRCCLVFTRLVDVPIYIYIYIYIQYSHFQMKNFCASTSMQIQLFWLKFHRGSQSAMIHRGFRWWHRASD